MQVIQENKTSERSVFLKLVLTFLAGGALSGFCFAWLITRSSLRLTWFATEEWWIFPTWEYWLVADLLFVCGIAVSYAISRVQGWLTLSNGRISRPLLASMLLAAITPLLAWASQLGFLYGLVLGLVIVSLFLSLALFVLVRRWDSWVAVLIFVALLIRTPLASIPDALTRGSMSFEWFEGLRYFLGSSLLAGLSGLWLARTTARRKKEKSPLL
jgi:hypothetical protein